MDKQLKAPLIPPKERLISDEEILKMDKLGKKVITVLQVSFVFWLELNDLWNFLGGEQKSEEVQERGSLWSQLG